MLTNTKENQLDNCNIPVYRRELILLCQIWIKLSSDDISVSVPRLIKPGKIICDIYLVSLTAHETYID